MCGITGYIDYKKHSENVINDMVKSLNYRGPDNSGFDNYIINDCQVSLGHTRLSILDLSMAGHQPMTYKHYTIVYNGEIYNYKEIRNDLLKCGHNFVSNTDTEVILHAYDQWGLEAVGRFIGMFAFAILDSANDELVLFRDRAGVKPLYYYFFKGLFIFGSELKPFHQHPGFKKVIDLNALALFFDFGYIPAPYCIFQSCRKLEPGNVMIFNIRQHSFTNFTYWDVEKFYKQEKLKLDYSEAKAEVKNLLISACNYRMISDVPVGIFLSGGYDSAAVAAILQKDRTEKLKTFTIGFKEGNNEAPYAKSTANFLGTDHSEYTCTTKEAQDIIPSLPYFYDEPYSDSSAIPTILVSQIARKQVTVALSADAGDEIFAGYSNYIKLGQHLSKLNSIPSSIKLTAKPFLNCLSNVVPSSNPKLKHKIKGIATALNQDKLLQAAELYRISTSLPDSYMTNLFINLPSKNLTKYNINVSGFSNELEIALAIDYQMYLQNDILTKVDRATMSVSLEGREPLLDHRLVEFAAQLPIEYKYNGISGKLILKDIVHDYIPKKMMDRPKTGFSLPIYKWLRGDLGYLIDEYLDEKSITSLGFFNTEFVLQQVKLFKNDKLHYKPFIWKLLMFQMWYDRWME